MDPKVLNNTEFVFTMDLHEIQKYSNEEEMNALKTDENRLDLLSKVCGGIINKTKLELNTKELILAIDMWLHSNDDFLQNKSRIMVWALGISEKVLYDDPSKKIELGNGLYAIAATVSDILNQIAKHPNAYGILLSILTDVCLIPLKSFYEHNSGKNMHQINQMAKNLEQFEFDQSPKQTLN